jgi:hypothetical protein
MQELEQSREFIRGQLSATDLIIREIWAEFNLQEVHNERREDNDITIHPK